jgi:hypothetical protein
MSFSPILPAGGLTGWAFLQRTSAAQKEALSQNQSEVRLTDAFRNRIREINSAEALVEDRELLTVALTSFGLEGDIDNKYYIRTIFEQDTSDPEALANRLADKRYLEMAKAFGFGDLGGPKTRFSGFSDQIVAEYETKRFATSVGDINPDMRLVLGLESDLDKIGSATTSNDTKWYSIMGNPPLRKIFEVAFGLPSSFGTLSLDKQLEIFKEKSQDILKTEQVSSMLNEQKLEKLTNTFLLRSQLDSTGGSTSGSIALTLLQSAPRLYQRQ